MWDHVARLKDQLDLTTSIYDALEDGGHSWQRCIDTSIREFDLHKNDLLKNGRRKLILFIFHFIHSLIAPYNFIKLKST